MSRLFRHVPSAMVTMWSLNEPGWRSALGGQGRREAHEAECGFGGTEPTPLFHLGYRTEGLWRQDRPDRREDVHSSIPTKRAGGIRAKTLRHGWSLRYSHCRRGQNPRE